MRAWTVECRSLPQSLGDMSGLVELFITDNQLTTLPPSIGKLAKLVKLQVHCVQAPVSLGISQSQARGCCDVTSVLSRPRPWTARGEMTQRTGALCPGCIMPFALRRVLFTPGLSVPWQASFNCLASLPVEMGQLPKLELFRIAVNKIPRLPDSFALLNSLAWFSLAGNPACAPLPRPRKGLRKLPFSSLKLGKKLGDGASGTPDPRPTPFPVEKARA